MVMMEYARYHSSFIGKAPTMNMKKDERIGGESGACGTSNYGNPIRKFAEFPFTEPIKQKTPSLAKMLIKCNLGRNK